ncbi:MAG: hypothetical protein R2867_45900 [Caldilineaceae bacterium]
MHTVVRYGREALMFNPSIYENSQSEGSAVLEVVPSLETMNMAVRPRQFIPLQRTELAGTILGPLAQLALTQIFCYRHTDC